MRSTAHDILPLATRRSLATFGRNLRIARIRRRLTMASMAERCGISVATWRRMEKGDPTVAIGAWAMALFILGEGSALAEVLAPGVDEVGMVLDEGRLPKRVRSRASERSPANGKPGRPSSLLPDRDGPRDEGEDDAS